MSEDQKIAKWYEHNKYKYETPEKDLPAGMTRIPSKLPSEEQVKNVI